MEHLQKIIYILSLFMPVMVFFALGLWFAWARWFKHSTEFHQAINEHLELVETLNQLYLKQTHLNQELQQVKSEEAEPPAIEPAKKETPEVKIPVINLEIQYLREELAKAKLLQHRTSGELRALKKENSALQEKLANSADEKKDTHLTELDAIQTIVNDFADEHVQDHPDFGILFQEEPDVIDNLTEMSHISSSISYKLYQLGVYRYRQIALWSPQQYDHVLEEIDLDPKQLSCENGDWQKEAAELHRKYYQPN